MEIEGPFCPEGRPKFQELLHPGSPTGKGSPYLWNDARAGELIEKLAFEASRHHTPEPEFLAGLQALHHENRTAGLSHRDSMVEALGIILASPAFHFFLSWKNHPLKKASGRSTTTNWRFVWPTFSGAAPLTKHSAQPIFWIRTARWPTTD